jgi:hypothetical protein
VNGALEGFVKEGGSQLVLTCGSWMNRNKKPSQKKKLLIRPALVLRHFVLCRFVLTAVASLYLFFNLHSLSSV